MALSKAWSKLPWIAKAAIVGGAAWGATELYERATEKSLKGELVVITGAGSGIGRLMAVLLAREGARLALWDVNAAGAKETEEMCAKEGAEARVYVCDVTDRARVYELRDVVKSDFGSPVDILINNAGIVSGKTLLENSDRMIQKTFEVNTVSHFWTVKAFLPDMVERNHGHVVTISSASAIAGVAGLCDYSASKWAVFGFDESLRFELQKHGHTGVKTTCVCPFFINTGMFDGAKTALGAVMPILEPDYVAGKIVEAVKRNTRVLMMPRIVYTGHFLRGILPVAVFDSACHLLGVNSSMDDFTGRSGSHGPAAGAGAGSGGAPGGR